MRVLRQAEHRACDGSPGRHRCQSNGFGRLPEAWIAPPASRELRELVRHRAKLVRLRSSLKCQVHAVLAGAGVPAAMADLFGAQGRELLDSVRLAPAMRARVDSCLRLIADIDVEIDTFGQLAGNRLRHDPGYTAVQTIPGIGPTVGAVFGAEIGDVRRFHGPTQLTSWAGLTPRHRESDITVHRGRITKQGSRLVRRAAIEAVQRGDTGTRIGAYRERVAERHGRNQGKVAAARELVECVFHALRVGPVRRQAVPACHRTTSSARPAHRDPSVGPGHGRSSSRSPAQPRPHLCRPRPTFEIDAFWVWRHVPYQHTPTRRPRPAQSCRRWWWPAGDRPG